MKQRIQAWFVCSKRESVFFNCSVFSNVAIGELIGTFAEWWNKGFPIDLFQNLSMALPSVINELQRKPTNSQFERSENICDFIF